MKSLLRLISQLRDQRGVTVIVVALAIPVLVGFTALALDIGHLYVVRNELQNAADAGALAGARFLYNADGDFINVGANLIASNAATANNSEGVAAEVNWTSGNAGDVQRGHWSFATRTFTPNPSTVAVDLWDVSTEDLDVDPNFINAIRVVTRREATPAVSFFARIFGHENFQVSAEAIAYIGFPGTLTVSEMDQPLAICAEALLQGDGQYSCSVGRMINSGENVASSETGGWTSFNQDNPCQGGTNANEVGDLTCSGGNEGMVVIGSPIATNGGAIQSAFNQLIECWENQTGKTEPWPLTLSVVNCPGNNVGTCQEPSGAVTVNIVWITGAGEDPSYSNAPTQMGEIPDGQLLDWDESAEADGQIRWNSFVQHFSLQNVDGTPAPYQKKSIYYLPDCSYHELAGTSGGGNFGILAKRPVLAR